MPGGERRGKRKRYTIFLERTREGHRQSDKHWNCFKGNVGELLRDRVEEREVTLRDGVERVRVFPSTYIPP